MTASGVILASLLPSESGLATSLAIIRRKSQLAKKDFRGRLKAYADVEKVEKKNVVRFFPTHLVVTRLKLVGFLQLLSVLVFVVIALVTFDGRVDALLLHVGSRQVQIGVCFAVRVFCPLCFPESLFIVLLCPIQC